MNEQEIIHMALDNLQKTAGITGALTNARPPEMDAQLDLLIGNGGHRYAVEVKRELRATNLPAIYAMAANGMKLIVIAERLFPKIKEALRQHGIAYLEANGNLFLRDAGAYVWTDTNKPLDTAKEKENRAFAKTGLKLVFQFLLDETWLDRPYRQIATEMGTGIGNITNVVRGLKQEGFLIATAKNRYKLANKKELLLKWIGAYEKKLKPALKIGTFRFLIEADFTGWKNLHLRNAKTWWGGEPAGDLFTDYLKPRELTLYTTEPRTELIKNYRLVPDELGHVRAYQKFWHDAGTGENYAPPLLVYADLMATGDPRCVETAQKVYDELLKDKF